MTEDHTHQSTERDPDLDMSSDTDDTDQAEVGVQCEGDIDRFWRVGEGFDEIRIDIEPPDAPLELLEQLGTSPFERGGFPLIGFLATTYDKVSRDALERG